MLTQRPSISDGWKAVNLKPQHPDTHLPICLSAWQVSATLCPDTKLNWLTAVSKRPSYQHPNRDHHEGETND